MILTTWSTSSSNVLYPYCFGVLGAFFGPLLMLLAFFVSWKITKWTVQAAIATRSETFGDLGSALLGWYGRILFEGSQILFQQLFLPVAIILVAGACQSLGGIEKYENGVPTDVSNTADSFGACNGNIVILFVLISWGLIQISRELENVTAIAYVTCILMVIMTLAMVIEAFTVTYPILDANSTNTINTITTNNKYELFVGQGNHPERYQWANVFSAIGTFVYSCLPSCIVVETMATLKPSDRVHMGKVVDGSFVAYAVIYLAAGLPLIVQWGGDLPEPVTNVFDNSFAGVVVKLVLIAGTLLDFVLASTTVNRFVMRWLVPNYNYQLWNVKNAKIWALYSIPSSLLAVCMALFIPKLQSLTGLLNSIAGATLQITAVPLGLAMTTNAEVIKVLLGDDEEVRKRNKQKYICIAGYGICFTALIFIAACYDIGTTNYVAKGNETFWCDIVGA